MEHQIANIINSSASIKLDLLNDSTFIGIIKHSVELITTAFLSGRSVYFCGNGGSAADAQHLAAEFSGRFYKDRKALPAEALHCNTSFLTAVANDYGFEHIYSRLIDGIGKEGDILIGISTSGNSENIVKAMETARSKKITTIGWTGANAGSIEAYCDIILKVPAIDTPRIQECHMMIGHIICEMVEKQIFG